MHKSSKDYQKIYNSLKNSKLFANLCDEALDEVIKECEYGTWKKADIIDPYITTKRVYFILNGRVKLLQLNPDNGRSVAIFILSANDIYDFFSLLDGKEHDIEPIALDNVEYISFSIDKTREWIDKHPEFNREFLPYLGEKMRELESFGESVALYDTTTRLAHLILKNTDSCKDDTGHYPVKLIHNMSHETLAELIGSVRSVVSLQMKKLRQDGVIVSKRGHLAVANLEKLIKKCDILHLES